MTEQTDRELLEGAARAAGIVPSDGGPVIAYEGGQGVWMSDGGCGLNVFWNPLNDDAAALRLAVKLRIQIDNNGVKVWCSWWSADGLSVESLTELVTYDDPYAATRRAIVRAAASLYNESKKAP